MFGQRPQQQGGLFGQQPQQQGGVFGQQPQQQGGVFGQRPPQQQGGLFGQQPQQQPGGLFGQQPQQQGGLFGQQPQQQGGLFGQQPQQQGGMFGQRPAQQAGGLFGQQQPQQQGGLFGQQQPQQQGGLFGQQQPQQQQGLFGQQRPPAAGGLFGTQPQQQGGGLFGGAAAAPQAGGGLFGQAGQTQQVGLFGNTAQRPQGTPFFGTGGGGATMTGGTYEQQQQRQRQAQSMRDTASQVSTKLQKLKTDAEKSFNFYTYEIAQPGQIAQQQRPQMSGGNFELQKWNSALQNNPLPEKMYPKRVEALEGQGSAKERAANIGLISTKIAEKIQLEFDKLQHVRTKLESDTCPKIKKMMEQRELLQNQLLRMQTSLDALAEEQGVAQVNAERADSLDLGLKELERDLREKYCFQSRMGQLRSSLRSLISDDRRSRRVPLGPSLSPGPTPGPSRATSLAMGGEGAVRGMSLVGGGGANAGGEGSDLFLAQTEEGPVDLTRTFELLNLQSGELERIFDAAEQLETEIMSAG